jgi:dTMP kinase
VRLLSDWLADRDPVVVREPGGTVLGERIRSLLLDAPDVRLSAEAELQLFLAARAQLLAEVVLPALREGRIVLMDRYHDSSRAYQGGARGLDVGWPSWLPVPDLTILFAVPAEVGLARRSAAGGANRMEAEALAFHQKVAAAYDRLAAAEPQRWLRVDATLPPAEVQDAIRARVSALLEVPTSS